MKKTILFTLLCLAAVTATAGTAQKTIIIGEEASLIFAELEGQFEHTYGAHVSGLTIDTVVRHNNQIICTKETTIYGDGNPVITVECSLL